LSAASLCISSFTEPLKLCTNEGTMSSIQHSNRF
jgi:hypothetical protein